MFFRKKATIDWIIVFLGNPGAKYKETRHNIGFMTGDVVESRYGVKINRLKFKSLTCVCKISGSQVFLMKPQTYMNLSGDAVREAMAFYKVPLENVIVVADDIALPVGKLRVRRSGSAGGHNGLKDIISKCRGEDFPRVKIGVGAPPNEDYDTADWVLSVLRNADAKKAEKAVRLAAEAIEAIVLEGVDAAMNKFN